MLGCFRKALGPVALAALLVGCSSGGTTPDSDGGADGGGGGGDSGIDLASLGTPCNNGACPAGLEAVTYCGIAGCSGGQLCSCEIRCGQDGGVCPTGSTCAFVSDGPGQVCVKN